MLAVVGVVVKMAVCYATYDLNIRVAKPADIHNHDLVFFFSSHVHMVTAYWGKF